MFFNKMIAQILKGIRTKPKEEWSKCIYQYFNELSVAFVVFHWTYEFDEKAEDVGRTKCS